MDDRPWMKKPVEQTEQMLRSMVQEQWRQPLPVQPPQYQPQQPVQPVYRPVAVPQPPPQMAPQMLPKAPPVKVKMSAGKKVVLYVLVVLMVITTAVFGYTVFRFVTAG